MSRRGENIFKRKDGLWEARYVKGIDEFGKKKYGSVYDRSYSDVKNKRAEIEGKILNLSSVPTTKRNMTLNRLVEEWLYINKDRVKPSTYQKYTTFYVNHIKTQIGKYQVIYITPIVVKQFTNTMTRKELSASTINDVLVFINTCLKYGSRQYALPKVEMTYIKTQTKEMRVLSIEEQRKLTNYLLHDTDIYKLGVLLALYTGMRIGELCALKWGDLKNNTITINKTIQRLKVADKTELVVGEPKSHSSNRVIPIPIFLIDLIEPFRQKDEDNFLSREGHPIVEPRVMQYQIKKQIKECNIADASFHSLRHSYASRCLEFQIDIKTISTVLGHNSIQLTADKYIHSSMEQKQIAVNKTQLIV